MFRPTVVLLPLLGLAGPAAGQAANTVGWTIEVGGLTLVPRIVFDTALGSDSARVVDSVRATPARLMDRYTAALPPDTLAKYRATILGFNLGDDYGCRNCWGGRVITQSQIAAWAAYARARLPGLPLGARVTPDWVAAAPSLAPLLDYTWAQYHTGKGDAQTYYDRAARTAARLGLRVIMGLNVHHCYGVGTDPCTTTELLRLGRVAVRHPASCAFLSWRYDEATWQRADIRERGRSCSRWRKRGRRRSAEGGDRFEPCGASVVTDLLFGGPILA
jgi:hypothetical protein